MYHLLKPSIYRNTIQRICSSLVYRTNQQMLYSSKDDGDKCSPKSYQYKTIRPDSPECNPKSSNKFDLKQIKVAKVVTAPCEPNYEAESRKYRIYAILGSIIFISTIVTAYLYGQKDQKEKSPLTKGKKRERLIIKDPESSTMIPNKVRYLLIGGGTASFSAFRAIKSADPTAEVLVISNENHFPYMRPPLSKEMWFSDDRSKINKLMFKQWNGSERSLFYEPDDFYVAPTRLKEDPEHGGVSVARGWNVNRIDPYERKAYLEDGYEISYEKCLIATGASPKSLDMFDYAEPEIKEKVQVYRGIADFYDIFDTTKDMQAIAIIGGGFLGSELACALSRFSKRQFKVYQIFREKGNMARILPDYLCQWTTDKVRSEGVEVISDACVTSVASKDDEVLLKLNTGDTINVDKVVLAVGVRPNTQLAQTSSLEIDPDLDGYLVNTELEARSDLYVAGDCACFYDTKLGRRRVEHHDHAVVSGRLAGENMTGARRPYWHQSMFWSDLGPDVGYEAIGIVDSSLPTVGVFAKASKEDTPLATNEAIRSEIEGEEEEEEKTNASAKVCIAKASSSIDPINKEDFGKGVIFYLKNDIVVGIVLWNVFNRMSIARQVLKNENKYEDLNEVAKLFNIHDEE